MDSRRKGLTPKLEKEDNFWDFEGYCTKGELSYYRILLEALKAEHLIGIGILQNLIFWLNIVRYWAEKKTAGQTDSEQYGSTLSPHGRL